ncbi:MAG: hypothetical protein M1822_004596 [Bathelium mastoideum]|nr:MAG: hypothetical protein M1822_004596 [Bathelium mastoideum]
MNDTQLDVPIPEQSSQNPSAPHNLFEDHQANDENQENPMGGFHMLVDLSTTSIPPTPSATPINHQHPLIGVYQPNSSSSCTQPSIVSGVEESINNENTQTSLPCQVTRSQDQHGFFSMTDLWIFGDKHSVDSSHLTIGELERRMSVCRQTEFNEPVTSFDTNRSLEQRMERVLGVIEDVGFENMDAAVTEYYTANFQEDTLPHWAQATSRSRRLRKFLSDLHDSTEDWNKADLQIYNQERMRFVEGKYVEQLSKLKHSTASRNHYNMELRALLATNIKHLLSDDSVCRLVKQDKQSLRERVCAQRLNQVPAGKLIKKIKIPDIWSLLTNLACSAGIPQTRTSEAICVFLYLLDLPR